MRNTNSSKSTFLQNIDPISAYLHDIRGSHKLTSQEEKALAKRIRRGDRDAIRKLVEANLKFVFVVARQYENRGLPLTDLISEGNLGLMRAAARFDDTQDCRFITYAVWWIRQALLTAIADQTRPFRLTATMMDKMNRVNKASRSLAQKMGREPSVEELELETGMRAGSIRTYMHLMPSALSLNAERDGEAGEYQDSLTENPEFGTEARMDRFLAKRAVDKMVRGLDKREREILRLFFGLEAGRTMTLGQLSGKFGLSKERIRQIRNAALAKLKAVLLKAAEYPCLVGGKTRPGVVP